MRQLSASIYTHLTLVLLLALVASFITMYVFFLSHLEQTRNSHLAHEITPQVRLVEALMQDRSNAALTGEIGGIRVAQQPTPTSAAPTDKRSMKRLALLKQQLSEQLQRPVDVIITAGPDAGFWITLSNDIHPSWVFIPAVERHPTPGYALEQVLLVGFAVFFIGGMGLLWRIQRPLKLLSQALELVGKTHQLAPLPVYGASEIRVLAQRFNEMVERLQRYEEERSTMLAGVTHDLRTPITRLRLLTALMQHPRNGEIIQNLDDIERITEQFLDYARGQNDEPLSNTDLTLFVEEVAAAYHDRGVTSEATEENMEASVRANSLRRAMVNLIENAIEYGRPPVVVRLSREGAELIIAIEDHGDGIPPQQIQQAMRPFTRLDPSRGGKGHCGLGLMISAKIAEQHLGYLELKNLSTGFAAIIHLPIGESDHR